MKHTIFFLNIIYFFIATQSLYAMQKQDPTKIVRVLSPNTIYLYKKNVLNYEDMTINNLITNENKTIEGLNNLTSFALHPNRTKIAFTDRIHGNNNAGIQIYDIEQHQIIKSIKPPLPYRFCSAYFNLSNNDLVVEIFTDYCSFRIMNIYNYNNGNAYINNLTCSNDESLILHPKKMVLCKILNSGHINTYNYHKYSKEPTIKQESWRSYLKHTPDECIVNHEGFIAINDPNQIFISVIHLDNIEKIVLELEGKSNKHYISMLFYPKGSILTTITQTTSPTSKKKFIQYWDILSKRCFETIDLPNQSNLHNHGDFYFSRNGKKIIFPCEKCEKSCIYYVPWKIRYLSIKDKCQFLIVLAKRYDIPNEITRIIMRLLKKW